MGPRQPIVAVLGHVDSGKTSLLDKIRGTGVQGREAGGITQHIGASFLPTDTLRKSCGKLYERLERSEFQIPGILVIDTPGHEVFRNLRSRGGSVADIAILVVDANKGFQMQTNESLEILRKRGVPFVIALNKVDSLGGWRNTETRSITESLKMQGESIRAFLDEKLYTVVGTLSVLGYESEAFWRVEDFKKQVAIVPISAKTGLGIPELLTVLVGLTQQYLQKRLDQSSKPSRGIVLEVNYEIGFGETANIILIDGSLKKSDTIVLATRNAAIAIKPKTILLPKPLDEMRDPRDKFKSVESVNAAAGVKIASAGLESVLPGSTMYVANTDEDVIKRKAEIESEIKSVFIDTESTGVSIKCDTIGSLEAVVSMLEETHTPIAKADIGAVNRRDIVGARAIKEQDRHLGIVLAFNVKVLSDAKEEADLNNIRIFENRVIYDLLDSYTKWVAQDSANIEDAIFAEIPSIAKFTFLKDSSFHHSNPAIFGIRIDVGRLKQKTFIMNSNGRRIGSVHQLQRDKKTVDDARMGDSVACSVNGVTIGRQITEESIYYTSLNSSQAKQISKSFMHRLSSAEIKVFNEMIEIHRKRDHAYGY